MTSLHFPSPKTRSKHANKMTSLLRQTKTKTWSSSARLSNHHDKVTPELSKVPMLFFIAAATYPANCASVRSVERERDRGRGEDPDEEVEEGVEGGRERVSAWSDNAFNKNTQSHKWKFIFHTDTETYFKSIDWENKNMTMHHTQKGQWTWAKYIYYTYTIFICVSEWSPEDKRCSRSDIVRRRREQVHGNLDTTIPSLCTPHHIKCTTT